MGFSPFKRKPQTYIRPWGKHKNGFFKLIYHSGSYAEQQKILNGSVIETTIVEIKVRGGYYDINDYAREHNFVKEVNNGK